MYGQADGHLRPISLGRLGGVDLKSKKEQKDEEVNGQGRKEGG